jgi:pimeloyl-ACP methyl ester carboxylesterase
MVLDGIKSILENEGIERFYILGSSWGGTVAQCFTYKYPNTAEKIVLSNTGAYSSKLVLFALKMHLKSVLKKPRQKVLDQYGETVLKLLSKPDFLAMFWKGIMDQYYGELFTYEDYIAMIKQQIDYIEDYARKLITEPKFKGSVLIISAKDETAATKKVRKRTTSLYKDSSFVEFETGGHAVAAVHPEAYKKAVNDFIKS